MALSSNVIGNIGEMEVSTRLMETGLFIVFLLGGKVPAFDLLAEIVPNVNSHEKPYQFLIQVKSTENAKPFTIAGHRLKTPVPKDKLNALIDRPLPSYIAGVDLNTSDVYLVPAFDRKAGYGGSIPDTFRLIKGNKVANAALLLRLKNDVISYRGSTLMFINHHSIPHYESANQRNKNVPDCCNFNPEVFAGM